MFLQRLGRCIKFAGVFKSIEVLETCAEPRLNIFGRGLISSRRSKCQGLHADPPAAGLLLPEAFAVLCFPRPSIAAGTIGITTDSTLLE